MSCKRCVRPRRFSNKKLIPAKSAWLARITVWTRDPSLFSTRSKLFGEIDNNAFSKKIDLLSARLYQSIPMQKQIFALAVLTLCTSSTFVLGAADTPETRRREAERYLQATPPKACLRTWPTTWLRTFRRQSERNSNKRLTSQLDIPALTKAMTDAMVKNFTTDELKALADFYGSPVGKSAMQKFGAYMADLMPTMQAEIMKAQAKAK